ncbi:MAG: type II toxin-antitoxin system Phd/YefM family antitoxin [Phycisphaerae bacterium]
MSKTITLSDLQATAAHLLPALTEELTITHNNHPIAHLRPATLHTDADKPRTPGFFQGKIWLADDFDAELPDNYSLGAQ